MKSDSIKEALQDKARELKAELSRVEKALAAYAPEEKPKAPTGKKRGRKPKAQNAPEPSPFKETES